MLCAHHVIVGPISKHAGIYICVCRTGLSDVGVTPLIQRIRMSSHLEQAPECCSRGDVSSGQHHFSSKTVRLMVMTLGWFQMTSQFWCCACSHRQYAFRGSTWKSQPCIQTIFLSGLALVRSSHGASYVSMWYSIRL